MKRILLIIALISLVVAPGNLQGQQQDVLTFVADLRGQHVAPAPVETAATAKATAVLVGNRFTVHGSFGGLSSPLRDIAKTPDDPGVHLHQAPVGQTSRYFHGLQVQLNADERSGIFLGTAILTDEQRKALLAGHTYVDIHTIKNGPGELRDQWRALDAAAAGRTRAELEDASPILVVAAATGASCH